LEPTRPVEAAIIDSDVHAAFRNGLHDLAPYMTASWRRRLGLETGPPSLVYAGSNYVLPMNQLYVNVAGGTRGEASPNGEMPCSDPDFAAEQHLDANGIHRAVILGQNILSIGAFPDPDVAITVASAYNEWMQERWLQHDERWRGAMLVAPQDPQAAAKEIDRVGDRPGIVSIVLPLHDVAMGERFYYPVYEAAQRHGLPICVHPAGTENVYARAPRTALAPTYYLEWHTVFIQTMQSNVVSLICHGVFERFPGLKVVITEGGFIWAIESMLKLDRDWLGLRDEVPWLTKPPSEYLRGHIRFTSQPLVEPHNKEHLAALLEMVYASETMVFSSDYPHWDFDDPRRALSAVPADLRRQLCVDNPRALYGDRLN
jgi:predicted TIM-barrel fold metal-dependent hydrolase